jgi:hypothetical protein
MTTKKPEKALTPSQLRRKRVVKSFRNAIISIVVLLILAVGAGAGYTWYMGQQKPAASSITVATDPEPRYELKAQTPAPDALFGAAIQSLTTPIIPGSNVTAIIHTRQFATCTIVVEYNKVASTDSGLKQKKADDFGVVSWTWTVEESVPVGKWPVTVKCAYGERSVVVIGELVVVDSLE